MTRRSVFLYCQICTTETLHVEKYKKWGYTILQCTKCGLGSTHVEDYKVVNDIYDSSYFNGGRRDGYHDYLGSESILRREFKNDVAQILHYQPSGRLLEIGCAYGFFLLEAQKYFEVNGLEISEHAVNYCRMKDLNVYQGELNQENAERLGTFDVIVLLDVIEHLSEPYNVLTLSNSMLNPNGIILISTGDWHSLLARVTGKNWRLMTPPQHLFFFPKNAFRNLIEASGFRILLSEYPWKLVPLGLVLYQFMNILGFKPSSFKKLSSIGLPVNLFDAVRIIGKKI